MGPGGHPDTHRQTAHQALLEGALEGSRVTTPVQELRGSIVEVGRVLEVLWAEGSVRGQGLSSPFLDGGVLGVGSQQTQD